MDQLAFSHILKSPDKYNPDTLNLVTDDESREYWLGACEGLMERNINYALANSNDPDVKRRMLKYKANYMEVLEKLKTGQHAYGQLTLRLLFDINEACLQEQGFFDLWKDQKTSDIDAAFAIFDSRLSEIDSISNNRERWVELCKGVLAGNFFDCGAKAVKEIYKKGFYEALQNIQHRPWLHDDLDIWLNKLESNTHRSAAIFVDNSGVDIVLGILPFARELLQRGMSIILCANESPALNDVTCEELVHIVQRASSVCDIITVALVKGNLVIKCTGQKGPCLDLRTISQDVTSIGNVKLLIQPSIVKRNGTAVLMCYRDMQGAPLYTAKWYRGNHEFYRYTPLENPSTRVFGLPGIFVDMNNSDDKKVVLRRLEPSLAGNFSCEVTADGTFSTQTATEFLDVVVTPESQPVLQAEKEKYQPGELMRANCTSAPAKPPANLTIYINDEPLRSSETTLHPWDGGLSWANVGVELKVSQDLFPGGRLRVTCNATVYNVYNESAKLDFFTPDTDPRPERITLGSNATRCFTSWLLIFFLLFLPIVMAQDIFNQDLFNEAYDNNVEDTYDENLYLIGSTPKKPLMSLIGQ